MTMKRLALAVLMAGTAGCSAIGTDCTDIGAMSQVVLTSEGQALPAGAMAEVCLSRDCESGAWQEDGRAYVLLKALPVEGSVDLQVRTLAVDGQVIDEDRLSAQVQSNRPNGPGCEPEVGVVNVRRVGLGQYEAEST